MCVCVCVFLWVCTRACVFLCTCVRERGVFQWLCVFQREWACAFVVYVRILECTYMHRVLLCVWVHVCEGLSGCVHVCRCVFVYMCTWV